MLSLAADARLYESQKFTRRHFERQSYLFSPDELAADRRFDLLHDELSDFFPVRDPMRDMEKLTARTHEEYQIYCDIVRLCPRKTLSIQYLTKILKGINKRVRSEGGAFRTQAMRITRRDSFTATYFPHWQKCPLLIMGAMEFVCKNIGNRPTLSAVVCLIAVIHAHPFDDGNGRTSRVMFNIVLYLAGFDLYVPILEFARVSWPSFILKIRRVLIEDDWRGILEFLSVAVLLSSEVQGLPASD